MNLLTDNWLPVRPIEGGTISWIGLSDLLTESREYEICLPRDDLELAALQLVICITQVLFTPANLNEIVHNCQNPMSTQNYMEGIASYINWFELGHPEYPFMQIRNIKAKEITALDKLMTGLTGATNSCFVNEAGQADKLCGGCVSIALFNQSANSPSFGGGFKASLRGGAPITTLIQGRHLRETVWLNILSSIQLEESIPNYKEDFQQPPTWVLHIEEKSKISAASIGLLRGLLWQPAHIELCSSDFKSSCNCCGREQVTIYTCFLKEKFNYTVDGLWPHPHSPRILAFRNGEAEQKFASFTTTAPTWTRLASFVVPKNVDESQKEGHQPSAVVNQARKLYSRRPERLRLAVGGYRNNQASILERRHEFFELNKGWHQQPAQIQELVDLGLGYKSALRKALYIFFKGIKDVKGAGVSVQESGETQYYRRTDHSMHKALAEAHFDDPIQLSADKATLRKELKKHCLQIFEEQTKPYLHDPELIKTMAVARRIIFKNLRALEPDIKGGEL